MAPQPPQIDDEDIQHRAAVLANDRGFKDILRRMKWDVFKAWSNLPDTEKREALYRDAQAIGRLEAKVQELAGGDAITKRKTEAAKRLRAGT